MYQRRGLKRLPRLFVDQLLRGELAELFVNKRQKLFSGARVALLHGGQDSSDVGHETDCTGGAHDSETQSGGAIEKRTGARRGVGRT